jgi:hypothetical protein
MKFYGNDFFSVVTTLFWIWATLIGVLLFIQRQKYFHSSVRFIKILEGCLAENCRNKKKRTVEMHDIETSIGKNTKNKKKRHQSYAKAGGKSSRKNIKIFPQKKKKQ